MVPEGRLERTEEGLLPAGDGGWHVLNAREVVWRQIGGMGRRPRLEGGVPVFEQLGVGLAVLEPGDRMT